MRSLFKFIISIIIIIINLSSSCFVFANNINTVKLTIGSNVAIVNGESVILDTAPYIQEGSNTTLVPLRFVSVALGIPESNISFDTSSKEITIIYQDIIFKFIAGTNQFKIGNSIYTMAMENNETKESTNIYTEIKESRAFVPLRAFEIIGMELSWDSATKTATITENPSNYTTFTQSNVNNLTEEEIREIEEEVVRLVNEERATYDLAPLEIDETLMQSARFKSEDMTNNDYLSHTSPIYGELSDLLNLFNIKYQLAGENIAKGQKTAESVVTSWMNSPGHRANILNSNFKYIGVGLSYGSNNYPYWTQQFSG